MSKHKNTILILISLVLFAYAGILSIVPTILTNNFDENAFGQKVEEETGLVTTVENVKYQMKPNLNLVIMITDWSSKYIDNQDCFDASYMEITTSPLSLLTKNFTLKEMFVNHAKFANQILPEGTNKLANLPKSISGEAFGGKHITIDVTGPVKAKNFKIVEIAPGYYNEKDRSNVTYTAAEVKAFLKKLDFTNVTVK